jgi:Uma2 family endonuclease
MIALSNYTDLTPEEYFHLEEKSPVKHEYIDGQIHAMAGTNDTYNILTVVTCDPRDQETATYQRFPKLIIEMLSDSTEAFDRGDKFNAYQTLESLEEYVLINSKHKRVATFRRGEQFLWILQTYQEENFYLQSLNLTASFGYLYEDVALETISYTGQGVE